MRKHGNMGSTLVLKLRAYVIKSPKQRYQLPHKKGLFLEKKLFKKIIPGNERVLFF